MDRPASPGSTDRRRFLTGMAAIGAAGVAGAGAVEDVPVRDGGPGAAGATGATGAGGGYRETDHVRRFYATARDGGRTGRK